MSPRSRPPKPSKTAPTLAVLVRQQCSCSHSHAKALIAAGHVQVDGRRVTDPAVRPDGEASIEVSEPAGGVPSAPRRPLSGPGFAVLHLDRQIVVVEKHPMVATIPVPDEDPSDPSLVARVSAALAVAGHKVPGLWVVHRIDRETSGLVLFARNARASDRLRDQFRARSPLREYVAWTEGVPEPREGRLLHRLHEDENSRRVLIARKGQPGKDAELAYRVEAANSTSRTPHARVRVRLVTGRRNQIRVQFSAVGWPLIGDRFYGAREKGAGRTALHAERLGFVHPATGDAMLFESRWAPDLAQLDRKLFHR